MVMDTTTDFHASLCYARKDGMEGKVDGCWLLVVSCWLLVDGKSVAKNPIPSLSLRGTKQSKVKIYRTGND